MSGSLGVAKKGQVSILALLTRFRVYGFMGLGFGGLWVWDLGFKGLGLGFRVWGSMGLGFRV